MQSFFAPRAIAVLGASADPQKLGYAVARNLIEGGYRGEVHLINPRGGFLFGRPMRPSLQEIEGPIDLAVLIVPAPATPQALLQCAQRGIRAAIIPSGGFRESGPAGAELEAECLRIARQYDLRFIGPNCIGILDTHLPLDTTFLAPPPPLRGDLALLSHSGALAAALIDWSRGQGFGFSRLVSLGNQADLTETDLLPACAADPHTRVLCLYLESLGEGRRFIAAARQITPHKPILALKTGRSQAGARAAASHTGALAGDEAAFDAAFDLAGVQRFDTLEEMFDSALALAACPLPAGGRTAILTNAGGPGVLAADALEAQGLTLASLSPGTLKSLQALLPPAGSPRNPVDMLASASPTLYADSLRLLLQDENTDAVLVILPPSPVFPTEEIAAALLAVTAGQSKPVLPIVMGADLVGQTRAVFRTAGLPSYAFPERAVKALGSLLRRSRFLQEEAQIALPFEVAASPDGLTPAKGGDSSPSAFAAPKSLNLATVEAFLSGGEDASAAAAAWEQIPAPEALFSCLQTLPAESGPLPVATVFALLEAAGIDTASPRLAQSAAQAAEQAAQMGFPLVMKIESPDILHKSDIGGVRLGIDSPQAAARAWQDLMEKASLALPQARLLGVTLQPQALAGQEVLLGMVRDPRFGPLMAFGSGGVEVEGLKDLAFGLAPLTRRQAQKMLAKTWAGRKLGGFRSLAAVDSEAVALALLRLAALATLEPRLAEMEINPLRVTAGGALALDARARLQAAALPLP